MTKRRLLAIIDFLLAEVERLKRRSDLLDELVDSLAEYPQASCADALAVYRSWLGLDDE